MIVAKLKTKYLKMSIPAKAALWFAICGMLQKGIQFLITPVFTRLLTTVQYGRINVYLSWYNIISMFLTLNLYMGGFNNGMIQNEDRRSEYLSAIQGLVVTITVGLYVVFLLTKRFWQSALEMDMTMISVMFLEILFHSSLFLWAARERFEFRYRKLVVYTVIVALLPSLAAIVGILLSPAEYGAEAKIYCNAVLIIILCAPLLVQNIIKGNNFYNKDFWIFALKFNIPLVPHYLSGIVLNQADRIMISRMVGDAEAGVYGLAYSAAMVLNVVTSAINQSFASWIYGKLKKQEYKGIKKITTPLFAGVAVLILMLIAFAPEAIAIFGGSAYKSAIWIIPSVSASLYFNFIFIIYANIEFYFMKNKYISYASMAGAVLNIILNYFGIKAWGYLVAGYTTLICYILFAVSHLYFMRRVTKDNIGFISLFDDKVVFGIGGLLVALSALMLLVYENIVARYGILLVLITTVFMNRKRVISIIKEIRMK